MTKPAFTAEALALAERVAATIARHDAASRLIGIRCLEVRPGYARMAMTVRDDMANGHHICHGGYLFTLADSAFAYACNSYNQNTLASACQIDFIAAAQVGDELIAECCEQSLSGRTGVYDTAVRKPDGRIIALFRGKSIRIGGEVIAGLAEK